MMSHPPVFPGKEFPIKSWGRTCFGAFLIFSLFFLSQESNPGYKIGRGISSMLQSSGNHEIPQPQENSTLCLGIYCLEGPHLRQSLVMQPSHFFIKIHEAWTISKCYGRAVGAPGIFSLEMTYVGKHMLRVDYMAHQEGDYKLWISCADYVPPWTPPELPTSAIFTPWFHHQTLPMLPTVLTILPNSKVEPRGCQPCQGPDIGTFSGQWVNATDLQAYCGEHVLGAVHEWFEDDFVWAARQCTYPFRSRAEFLERFDGASILFAGDSTMRGQFIDMQNWLWYGIGPETLQAPFVYFNETSFHSSWDERVSGFNTENDMRAVTPNPFEVGRFRAEYIEVTNPVTRFEDVVLRTAWRNKVELAKYHYHATVINYGLWGMTSAYQFSCQLPAYLKNLFERFICRPVDLHRFPIDYYNDTLPSLPDSNIGYEACSWRDYDQSQQHAGRLGSFSKSKCLEKFPGRLVYRSTGAKHSWDHACVEDWPYPRGMCQLDRGITQMIEDVYDNSWDGDLVRLDMYNLTHMRPDRALDGYHFFPRPCFHHHNKTVCSWRPEIPKCCFAPDFPQVGSLTLTNIMINLLWHDPRLLKH